MDEKSLKTVTEHLVRPEDLNHHGTLFAGQMASWLVEAGVITTASLIGRPEDILCVQVNSMTFKKPIYNGDLLRVETRVAHFGTSSITVSSTVTRKQDQMLLITFMATFVTTDKSHRPYAHGLKLTDEYIKENRAIYDAALKIRENK